MNFDHSDKVSTLLAQLEASWTSTSTRRKPPTTTG